MTPTRRRPLVGLRVLVPRGGEWGNSLAARLRAVGAAPVVAPMVNFASTPHPDELAIALGRLQTGHYDWLVMTSATAVDVLVSHQVEIPEGTRVAAIGETTAGALLSAGYRIDFVPERDNSPRGLEAEWSGAVGPVLVPQSDQPDASMREALARFDVAADFVTAFRTVGVPVSEEVRADVASGAIGAVLITSGTVARQMTREFEPFPDRTVVASIGPRTAFDARTAGIRVSVIAESRTPEALVEALVDHVEEMKAS